MSDDERRRTRTGSTNWRKGMPSPNPGGWRAPQIRAAVAMAKLIHERTDGGKKLVDFAMDVLEGKAGDELADAKSRRWACDFLADRCLGRAPQTIEISTGEGAALPDMRGKTVEELRALAGRAPLPAEPAPDEPVH
jgi:hypothetical protein